MKSYKFCVVIPVYNDWDRLSQCLSSLASQTYDLHKVQVVVVNNNPDNPPPSGFQFGDALHITQTIPGSYAARNLGVQYADAEVLAFTDADCLPGKTWLEEAEKCFSESNLDMLLGNVKLYPLNPQKINAAEAYDIMLGFSSNTVLDKMATGVTANLFVTSDCFNVMGGFDSRYYSGGDFHFIKSVIANGYKTKASREVVVLHPARRSLSEIVSKGKRKSGARIRRRINQNIFKNLAYLLKPPLSSIRKIMSHPDFGIYTKLKAICIALVVYFEMCREGVATMLDKSRESVR